MDIQKIQAFFLEGKQQDTFIRLRAPQSPQSRRRARVVASGSRLKLH
jgi:hypothetical protein